MPEDFSVIVRLETIAEVLKERLAIIEREVKELRAELRTELQQLENRVTLNEQWRLEATGAVNSLKWLLGTSLLAGLVSLANIIGWVPAVQK